MGTDAATLFKSNEFFSACTDDDLSVIASHSRLVSRCEGELVFGEGEPTECLYVVDRGEVVIRRTDDEGLPVDIARFVGGDCVGELDLFSGDERSASAVATRDTELWSFPASDGGFNAFLGAYPGVGARLLHAFLVRISDRIRGVNALVRENSPLIQDLKRQVYADKLTGLNNKTCFEETLQRVFASHGGRVGLLMYKPDNFKEINDSRGHEAGDRVLRRIADGLAEIVPDRDMLFRYMGNENAVILPGGGREELTDLAARIGDYLKNLDLADLLGDPPIQLSVSFGLGTAPEHGASPAELIDAVHPLPLDGRRRGGNLVLFPGDQQES